MSQKSLPKLGLARLTVLVTLALACVACGTNDTATHTQRNGADYAFVGNRSGIVPLNLVKHATDPLLAIPTIPGQRPISVGPLASASDGLNGYTFSTGRGSLLSIDLSNGKIRQIGKTFPMGWRWVTLSMGPDRQIVYIAFTLPQFGNTSGAIVPVNATTGAFGKPLSIPGRPNSLSMSPNGQTAYVGLDGGGKIIPVNLLTGSLGTGIVVPDGCAALAITPDGRTGYAVGTGNDVVAGVASSFITPVDLVNGTLAAPIRLEVGLSLSPNSIVLSRGGSTAFAIGNNDGGPTAQGTVWSIDLAKGDVSGAIAIPGGAETIA
jgi:hypothetical protein